LAAPGYKLISELRKCATSVTSRPEGVLLPFHQNQLLRMMEEDQLRNALRVHALQDQAAEAVAARSAMGAPA
jgi:hypothetical protein